MRWLGRVVKGRARAGWPLAWPIAVFSVITLAAALHAALPADSLMSSRNLLLLASVWIVRDALPDARAARRALLGLLAVLVLTSLVGVAQVAFCGAWPATTWPWLAKLGSKCHRARGFYSIYMTLGGVLDIALLATLPLLIWARGRPRWAPLAWLVSLVAFALTYVRGAWLGFVTGIAILSGSLRRGRAVLFGGLVALAVVLLLLPGVRTRVRSIADPNDPTSSERVLMWRSGAAMARDHLWLGVGPGQVKRVYPRYAAPEVTNKSRGHLHNSPIQVLVERGIFGLLAWIAIFAAFFVRAARSMRQTAEDSGERALVSGAIAAVAAFLVAGLFEHNFGDSEVLLVATFVIGSSMLVSDPVDATRRPDS